jgi:hypothetical protein
MENSQAKKDLDAIILELSHLNSSPEPTHYAEVFWKTVWLERVVDKLYNVSKNLHS